MKSYTLRPDIFTLNFNVLFQVLMASLIFCATGLFLEAEREVSNPNPNPIPDSSKRRSERSVSRVDTGQEQVAAVTFCFVSNRCTVVLYCWLGGCTACFVSSDDAGIDHSRLSFARIHFLSWRFRSPTSSLSLSLLYLYIYMRISLCLSHIISSQGPVYSIPRESLLHLRHDIHRRLWRREPRNGPRTIPRRRLYHSRRHPCAAADL